MCLKRMWVVENDKQTLPGTGSELFKAVGWREGGRKSEDVDEVGNKGRLWLTGALI